MKHKMGYLLRCTALFLIQNRNGVDEITESSRQRSKQYRQNECDLNKFEMNAR